MKTIYNWLLLNMGNEANFYTILNSQRSKASEPSEYIRVMARSKEFKIFNILIGSQDMVGSPEDIADLAPGEARSQEIGLDDEQAVIDYLTTGEEKSVSPDVSKSGIRVWITEPRGEAGEVSFPPEQEA